MSYTGETAPDVRARFAMVLSNGLTGLALVVLVLALFLDLRTRPGSPLSIPVSMLGTFAALRLAGASLDSISLTVLVLAIGMVVDNSIIFSEAIAENRARGLPAVEAAVLGVRANLLPVTTMVTTTIVAFLPLLVVRGVIGQFVSVIPLVVHRGPADRPRRVCRRSPRSPRSGRRPQQQAPAARVVRPRAGRLRAAGELPPAPALPGSDRLCRGHGRLGLVRGQPHELRPLSRPGEPSGSSSTWSCPWALRFSATSKKVEEVERVVAALPAGEVEETLTRVGTAGYPPIGQAGNYAMIIVRLAPYARRARTADQIVEELRLQTDRLEGYVRIAYDIDAGGVPVGRADRAAGRGRRRRARGRLARRLEALLAATPGVRDVTSDDVRGKDQLTVELDRPALARLGLTAAAVASTVRLAWDGEVATSLRHGRRRRGLPRPARPRSEPRPGRRWRACGSPTTRDA